MPCLRARERAKTARRKLTFELTFLELRTAFLFTCCGSICLTRTVTHGMAPWRAYDLLRSSSNMDPLHVKKG